MHPEQTLPRSIVWLRVGDLMQRRKRGRSSLYRDISEQTLTPPVKVGINSSAWPEFEIDAIDRARLAGASDDDIRNLVRELIAARKAAA